jgi:acyl carrier protein
VVDVVTVRQELVDFLRNNIVAQGVEFDQDKPLRSVGIDSLSLVEVLLFVERRFGIWIPDSHLTRSNLETVSSLADCVHQLLSQKSDHFSELKNQLSLHETNTDQLPLTESDYFVLALDRQMRSNGLPGNICRLVLRLDGHLALKTLREAAHNCPSVNWLAGKRIKRRLPFTVPSWFSALSNGELLIAEHQANEPGPCPVSIANSSVNHKLNPSKEACIAFDLIQYPDRTTDLVLSWHHVLMGARGAELLLDLISNPEARTALLDNEFSQNQELQRAPGSARQKLFRRLVFARQSRLFIDNIHRQPLATIVPESRRKCLDGHSYRSVYFSEPESRTIEANCEQQGGSFYKSLFVLAAVIRALHAIRAVQCKNGGAYVVTVPQNMRKRGVAGPIFSNHLTFLFYRIEPENLESTKTLVACLKQQMTGQLRSKFPAAFSTLMGLFRRLPLSLYAKIVGGSPVREWPHFYFSDMGECLQDVREFLGIPITGLYHLAPVAIPPGIAVICGRYRDQLNIVLTCVTGCLTEQEMALFENTIRAELLRAD